VDTDKTLRIKGSTYQRLKSVAGGFETVDEVLNRVLNYAQFEPSEEALDIAKALEKVTQLSYIEYDDYDQSFSSLKGLNSIISDLKASKARYDEASQKAIDFVREGIDKESLVIQGTNILVTEKTFTKPFIILDSNNVSVMNNLMNGGYYGFGLDKSNQELPAES